jgi:hypothetical protein
MYCILKYNILNGESCCFLLQQIFKGRKSTGPPNSRSFSKIVLYSPVWFWKRFCVLNLEISTIKRSEKEVTQKNIHGQ